MSTVALEEDEGTSRADPHSGASRAADFMSTGRLETFADGVFAIAITLLVLQIRVPPAGSDLGSELLNLWPSFVAYVASFLTIGIMWVNHHRLFTLIRRATPTFLMINVIFLMGVSFLPYPTAVLAVHIEEPAGRVVATLLYGGTMVFIAIMFNVLWVYASRGGQLLGPDAGVRLPGASGFRIGPVIYLAITLTAFVNPLVSLGLFALFAVYWLLPSSGPYGSR